MGIERDPLRHTLHPKPGIDRTQRRSQMLQVLHHQQRTDIDVHGRMPGVVKPCRNPTDHHEIHPVIAKHLAETGNAVVVDLAVSHGR